MRLGMAEGTTNDAKFTTELLLPGAPSSRLSLSEVCTSWEDSVPGKGAFHTGAELGSAESAVSKVAGSCASERVAPGPIAPPGPVPDRTVTMHVAGRSNKRLMTRGVGPCQATQPCDLRAGHSECSPG